MGWLVRLMLDGAEAEVVSSLLWDAGTTGIVEDGDVLLAGFDDRATAEAVAQVMTERATAAGWPVRVLAVEPVEWRGSDEATTVTVAAPDGRTATLSIVAGPTFGHGAHPTTALSLDLLAETVLVGHRVLDVGTGSGVLAIAAAALGAGPVVGIDIDPTAVAVAEVNARANGVEIQARAVAVDAAADLVPARRFDVIVVNVLLVTQRELAASITPLLTAGGSLITSGYLLDDGTEIEALYRPQLPGEVAITVRQRDGWLAHRFSLRDRCD